MAIVYCSWATGDDTNGTGTAANPYKTITKASTGLTGGDEVRVAKSPEPTALTGTLGFTNNSTAVTGNGTAFTTELAIGDFIKGGDDYWWEVVTITSDTAAVLYKKYSGTTQSGISSQKLGVTDTGEAALQWGAVQTISSSGTSTANLKISGGWDLSTESQTGQTYFRQTGANRYGYGLYINGKSYTEISRLHFLRYFDGVYYGTSGNNKITSPICESNSRYGIYYYNSNLNEATSPICNGNGDGICCYNAHSNTVTSPVCNTNANNGLYYTSNSANNTAITPTCNSNVRGIFYSQSSNNIAISPTCNRNTTGVGLDNSHDNIIYGTLTGEGNTYGIISTIGNNYISKSNVGISTPQLVDFANTRVNIGDINGHSEIWTDGGNIVTQTATAGGTGKEWKFSVTSSNRGAAYPLDQEVARVLVAANKQVSVKLYFKKSHASNIKAGLFMRGKQIAGVDNDILQECPADTNRNQVTLTFTPTEAGVVSIEAHAWYVSSTTDYVIVDDIDITQAD